MSSTKLALASLCILTITFLASAGGDAQKIVGTWDTRAEDQPVGGTIEFAKDGKLRVRYGSGGKAVAFDGTYKVAKNKLSMTLDLGGQTKTDTSTIKKLTDKELHLEDAKGMVSVYKRVK